jgi:hypothetical protein
VPILPSTTTARKITYDEDLISPFSIRYLTIVDIELYTSYTHYVNKYLFNPLRLFQASLTVNVEHRLVRPIIVSTLTYGKARVIHYPGIVCLIFISRSRLSPMFTTFSAEAIRVRSTAVSAGRRERERKCRSDLPYGLLLQTPRARRSVLIYPPHFPHVSLRPEFFSTLVTY